MRAHTIALWGLLGLGACDRQANTPARADGPSSLAPAEIENKPRNGVVHDVGPATSSEEPRRNLPLIRDSGGIRIVQNVGPSWTARDSWTLDTTAFMQLGVAHGDPHQEFSYIDDGAIAEDGTVVLADRQIREIRLFSARGEHLLTFGRQGDGPGEFRGAGTAPEMAVTFASSDTLIVSDGRRITWFAPDGSWLRDFDIRNAIVDHRLASSYAWLVAVDGSVLMIGSSAPGGRSAGENWVYLARPIPGEPKFTLIATYRTEPRLVISRSPGSPRTSLERPFQPLGPAAVLAGEPLRVFVADPQSWEIRVYTPDGTVERIIRLPLPRRPVTTALIAAAREQLRARRKGHSRLAELLRAYDGLSHPDSMPAIARMYWDEAGYLWVEHYSPNFTAGTAERRFEVLRGDGEWLGHVAMPASARSILRIAGTRVLTRYVDLDGVNYARIYRIARSRSDDPRP